MANKLKVLANLDIDGTTTIFDKDLKKIANKLKNMGSPKFVASLDIEKSTSQIKKDLRGISKNLTIEISPNLKLGKTSGNSSGGGGLSGIAQQTFNTQELDEAGIKYYKQVNDIVNRVKKEYSKLSDNVNVDQFKNARGQIGSFIVTVTKAGNVIEKFNYQRAKLNTGSGKIAGFVQQQSSASDKTWGTELQRTSAFLSEIERKITRIKDSATEKSSPIRKDTEDYGIYIAKLNETETKLKSIKNTSKVLSFEQREDIKKTIFDLNQLTSKLKYSSNVPKISSQGLDNNIKVANAELTVMENKWKSITQPTKELQLQYDELRKKLLELRPLLNGVKNTDAFQNYSTQMRALTKDFKAFNETVRSSRAVDSVAQRAEVLAQRINAYIATNGLAAKKYGTELKALESQARSATSGFDVTKTSRQFQVLTNQIKSAGMAGDTLFTKIVNMGKKFAQWYGVSQIFMRAIGLIRQTVTNVKDLDTAMVSLKKVTDETASTYKQFFESSAQNAIDLSVKLSDLITQTAEWAKLGKSMDSASKLAKASAVYQIVGEVDSQTAVKDLISAQKAFSLSDDAVMGIVDRMNNLSNKYALSAADLGSGLAKAASALALGGNDLNQTMALIVGGTEITQDSEKTANAIKILTLRLRGMKGELQEIGEEYDDIEDVSKIQTQIYNLTSGKVNIYDQNKELRNTYDIMNDIASVYKDMSQVDQNQLIEIIAGKNRSNEVSAVLQSLISGQAQKAYQDAQTSAGSAMKEQERWADSIEAKTNKVASQFEYLSSVLVNSEGLKSALDIINDLMGGFTKLVKNFGAGNLALGTLVASMISHFGGLGKAITFNGSSLNIFGKQFNLFNKNLLQTNQTMGYTLGTFNDARKDISLYNQSTAEAIKFQQGIRDSMPTTYTQAYMQSLNGAKASMQGYTNFLATTTYQLQGASGAIQTYNNLQRQGLSAQMNYARALTSVNPQLANFLLSCNGSTTSLRRFNIAATVAKVGVTGLRIATTLLKGVFMGIASLLVSQIVQGIMELGNASKHATQETSQLAESLGNERQALGDLKNQYESILDSQDDEATKTEKLNEIKKQLIETYGMEKAQIDAINDSRREGSKLIDEEMKKQNLDYLAKSKKTYDKIMESTKNSAKNQNKYAIYAGLDGMSKDVKSLFADRNIDEANVAEMSNASVFKQYEDIKTLRRNLQEIMSKRTLSTSENVLVDQVEETYNKLHKLLESEDQNWLNILEQHATARANVIYNDFLQSNKSFDDVYLTSEYDAWYQKLISLANDDFEVKAIKDLLSSFKGLNENSPVEAITDLDKALQSLQNSQSNFDKLSESIKTASDSLQDLNQIVKDNESTDKFFSSQEIIELLDKYPELSTAIQQTAYGYKIEENALKSLRDAKLSEQKVALQAQLEESKSALANAKTRLSAYAQEVKGIQTVAQAKSKLAEMELNYNNLMVKTSALSMLPGMSGFSKAITGGYNSTKADLENYIQAMNNVDEYQGTINKLQTQIDVLGTSFEDIADSTGDTNDNLSKQKDIIQDMQDGMKDAQEQINDLLDLTIDMLKKQKDLEKDVLNAQLDGLKEVISRKKEQLDIEKETHYFQQDLAEKNKSVATIQQEIDDLSTQGTLESKKKIAELNEKLAEEKKTLDNFLYDNEVEQRKNALDTEEKLFEDKINEQLKVIEDYLGKDAKIRQDAMDLINGQSQQFYNDLTNYTQIYTNMSEYEFNKLWNSAYNALRIYGNGQIDIINTLAYLDQQLAVTDWQLKQLENSANNTKNSFNNMTYDATNGVNQLNSSLNDTANKMNEINRIPLPRFSWSNPLAMADYITNLRGESNTNHSYWETPTLDYLSGLPKLSKYHTGGIVGEGGSTGSEVLAKLLTGEVVSTQNQAETFISRTLPNLFKGVIKLSNDAQPNQNVNININVEGNADDTTINKLKTAIKGVVIDTFGEINKSKRRYGSTPNTVRY